MKALIFALAMFATSAFAAQTQPVSQVFNTGNEFLALSPIEQVLYVTAVTEATIVTAELNKTPDKCIPPKVTAGQLTLIVKKFMIANPQKLHWNASFLIIVALAQAFC